MVFCLCCFFRCGPVLFFALKFVWLFGRVLLFEEQTVHPWEIMAFCRCLLSGKTEEHK